MSVRTYTPAEIQAMPVGDALRLRREVAFELRRSKIAGKRTDPAAARLLLELDQRCGPYSDEDRARAAAEFLWTPSGARRRGFNGDGA